MKQLTISAIKEGTVIDHIPASSVFKIAEILKIKDAPNEASIATNLPSKRLGRKGIIKISNLSLEQSAIDAIALLAEGATISIIKNYEVDKKQNVKIPNSVSGIIKCFNPSCITNHEQSVTKFEVIDKKELKLRCNYCEKITTESTLRFL